MNPATTAAKSSKIQELINQIKAMKRGEATNYPAIQDLQNAATETIQIKRFKLLRARYKENGNPQPEKPSNGEGFTPQ